MTKPSRANFLDYLKRSRLMTAPQYSEFVDSISNETDAEKIAELLVEQNRINRWHADNLLKGKYRGFTLGKYKLLGHLGTGGMSSVYLAEHPVMERLVAVKVLPKKFVEDPNYLDRFKREARAAAALDHPNIVRAYDIDQDGDRHYIVMEYIEGKDLLRKVKDDGPASFEEAADYIAQAARGLQHAHDAGLVHRDIKPANCLLDSKGVVKLLDMGLAKFSEDDRTTLSAIYDDSVVGTADYLAPEQAINSQKVDSRADIYSLGCTLYFLLSGQPPFPEGSIAQRLLKHQREEPTSIYHMRPDTPRTLADLMRRMMIKNPDDRIQYANVVEQELVAWLSVTAGVRGKDAGTDSGQFGTRFGGRGSTVIPPSGPQLAGDTATNALGDTARFGGSSDSSINDNLTLAPLEEELPRADEPADEETSKEEQAESSSIHDHLDDAIEPHPIDKLLKDEKFAAQATATLPKTQLRTAPESIWEKRWLPYAIIGGLVGVALLILVVTLMLAS